MMKTNYNTNVRKCCIFSLIFLFILSSFAMVSSSEEMNGTILYVGGSGEGNFSSINDAIDNAALGDTLFLYEGVYNENIVINKSINIVGQDSSETIIRGNGEENVISIFASNVLLHKITVKNSGIAVYETSQSNSSQDDDTDDQGGIVPVKTENVLLTIPVNFSGIYVESDNVNISSCVGIDCHSGVIFRNASDGTIYKCSFYNNSQFSYVVNAKQIELIDCQIYDNGIGVYFIQSVDCLISDNEFLTNVNALMFSSTDSSLVHHNYFEQNDISVILIDNCFENIFYQNTFLNSIVNHVIDNCNNSWDNGLVGNYWDDYSGVDANDDGIGDSSYFIPQISYDHFPLMEPVSDSSMIHIIISTLNSGEKISGSFLLKGSIIGSNDVRSVRIKIDNGSWMNAQGTNNWQYMIETIDFEDGDHTLFVSAVDSMDQSTVETLQFEIENGNGSGNDDSSEETPGFLLISILIAVLFIGLKKIRIR